MTIELRDLSKTYHSQSTFPVKAVQAVNLMIEQGEFVAIMGPSGSGKTTLLNLISGIDTATSGEVVIDDVAMSQLSEKQRIEFRRDHIGFIFQDYSLLPVLTATENVEFILLLQGKSAQECRARANELLEQVGLSELKDRYPTMMSGGQQQRVAIARALAAHPKFVLADEPTANLDAKNTIELLSLMKKLNKENGTTFIFSSHDPRVINQAERVIVFDDGCIVKDHDQSAIPENWG